MGKGPQKPEEIDEHNVPTEPLEMPPLYDQTQPALPPTQPLAPLAPLRLPAPEDDRTMPAAYPYRQSGQQAYPVLPAYPVQRPVSPERAGKQSKKTRAVRQRQSVIPVSVGMLFVILQVLLLIRFGLRLVNIPVYQSSWVDLLYALTDIFVQPFHALWQQIALPPLPANIEVYTLAAILAYGLFSRLLVRGLKIIERQR